MRHERPKFVLLVSAWWNEEIVRGAARYAAEAGWHLDMQMALTGLLPENWRGDGVIAMPSKNRKALSGFLGAAGCPVVAMNLSVPQLRLHRVAFDSRAIGSLGAEHFLDRSFRSFAWYSRDWGHVEQMRCKAFADALAAAGFDCAVLAWPLHRGRRKDSWQTRQQWLQDELMKLRQPLGVFSTDDTVAVEVIAACLDAGLKIPRQVAVLGCGDLEAFRESTSVPLSSIRVDFNRLTQEACELLNGLMNGAVVPMQTRLLPPGEIVVRKSTDMIASDTAEIRNAIRFMFEHFAEPIGIHDIAAAGGLSKTRLYAAFQKEFGKPPGALLTRIRMEKAMRMLRDSSEKVSSVAKACGFGGPITLYRHFQRHLTTSPRAYRRQFTPSDTAG